MAHGIQVKGLEQVKALLEEIGEDVEKRLIDILLRGASIVEGSIREEVVRSLTKRPTGSLARSFKAKVTETGKSPEVGVYSNLPYADIQDEGGTIRAGFRKLAVPLTDRARRSWPREWPKDQLFGFKSKRGNFILAERMRSGRLKPHYVLKDHVTIKGAGYIKRAAERSEKDVLEFFSREIDKLIAEAG